MKHYTCESLEADTGPILKYRAVVQPCNVIAIFIFHRHNIPFSVVHQIIFHIHFLIQTYCIALHCCYLYIDFKRTILYTPISYIHLLQQRFFSSHQTCCHQWFIGNLYSKIIVFLVPGALSQYLLPLDVVVLVRERPHITSYFSI